MFERRQMTIRAEPPRLAEVRGWARDAVFEFGFEGDDRYLVVLAVSEAVTNAIEHGSGSPGDEVRITLSADGDLLVCEVLDTGGFVAPAGIGGEYDERGRGLEIVAVTMDSLELVSENGGSLLRFSKRRV